MTLFLLIILWNSMKSTMMFEIVIQIGLNLKRLRTNQMRKRNRWALANLTWLNTTHRHRWCKLGSQKGEAKNTKTTGDSNSVVLLLVILSYETVEGLVFEEIALSCRSENEIRIFQWYWMNCTFVTRLKCWEKAIEVSYWDLGLQIKAQSWQPGKTWFL